MKITRRTLVKGTLLLTGCAVSEKETYDDENKNGDDMNNFQLGDVRPVSLRASTVITSNSDEEVSAGPLTNASGEPMEIHEFIFSVRPTLANIAAFANTGKFPSGGQFAIGLSVKDSSDFGYALTNGVIPLWSFGQARQLGQEEQYQSLSTTNLTTQSAPFYTSVYAWKLDHPLYLPPGGRINPVVRLLGSFLGDAQISIIALGKILPNTPPNRHSYKVPWVCAYLSKLFSVPDAKEDSSSDNSLYNPFTDQPVTIERFVGRMHLILNQSALGSEIFVVDGSSIANDTGSNSTADNFFSQYISIRMRDSIGNPIVRAKTLFRNVFEPATRTWECRHILPPKQFHKVDFSKPTVAAVTTSLAILSAQVSVASVGWREVSWKRA